MSEATTYPPSDEPKERDVDIENSSTPTNTAPQPQMMSGQSASRSKEANIENGAPIIPEEDIIPEGGYGWVVVGCIAALNATTWGINTTYGVYSSYYLANNYFEGGSTLNYAWVGGLSVATCLLCGPLANALSRWLGFRITMLFGVVGVVLGQCMAGICRTFGEFLFCQGILFGIGLGLTLVPSQPLLAHWFKKRLALAQGLGTAGSGLGGLILSNTTRLAIDRIDVKWALIINGLISLVCMVPAVLLLKGRHKAVGARQAPFELKWVVHPGFVWVWLWAAFTMMAYFIALYSLASFATSGLNLSQTKGAALQSILAAGQMIGRPLWGYFLDTGGRINLTIVCYVICGLSTLVIWLPAKSFGVLVFYAIIQGMTGGTIWSVAAPLTARVVGIKDLASALSIFWLILVIPALVGQPIAIALLDYSQNKLGRTGAEAYYISIGFCGALAIFATGLLYGAKRWIQGNWRVLEKT
ncbi:uncharacterized protein I303_104916 [Kwoniella dejecticola CBS 10117]|uniref:Major facilitator superfamily (MFS) profile domain-containing protein n=1 Tax=Kwoniella dejecticola CBS 10117 TaxID=1296121 RepID=A0A1A6A3Z4_9TREE|nr:uncharacterized protein I303_05638 [Kwoniella dejecticola CBS 10117]OBR84779.1 hypothetical protein I303_05638 [Kwoniella dejecticola CBS 10117]